MNRIIKFLAPLAIASVAGVVAVQSAEAASCATPSTSWTTLKSCDPPNQNLGSIQGGGILNTNGRNLFLQVTNGFAISGRGRGFSNSAGTTLAFGPNGNCDFTAPAGSPTFSPSGRCNNGTFHRVTITF